MEPKDLLNKSSKTVLLDIFLYAELKTILERLNVSWTTQHNSRAVFLNLVDKEQNRRNLKDSDIIRIMYYTRKYTVY